MCQGSTCDSVSRAPRTYTGSVEVARRICPEDVLITIRSEPVFRNPPTCTRRATLESSTDERSALVPLAGVSEAHDCETQVLLFLVSPWPSAVGTSGAQAWPLSSVRAERRTIEPADEEALKHVEYRPSGNWGSSTDPPLAPIIRCLGAGAGSGLTWLSRVCHGNHKQWGESAIGAE